MHNSRHTLHQQRCMLGRCFSLGRIQTRKRAENPKHTGTVFVIKIYGN